MLRLLQLRLVTRQSKSAHLTHDEPAERAKPIAQEIMNGKPDTLKGSYYANPVLDTPTVSDELRKAHPEYYGNNICGCLPMSQYRGSN
jgi:hypothetical protein